MNREILFRAKSIESGAWVYGSLCDDPYRIEAEICDHDYVFLPRKNVDPDTVGQYTGVCDNNGNKIFEGDVMKTQFSTEPFGVVRWHINGYWFLDVSFGEKDLFTCDSYAPLGELMQKTINGERITLEIIGNIYDIKEGE